MNVVVLCESRGQSQAMLAFARDRLGGEVSWSNDRAFFKDGSRVYMIRHCPARDISLFTRCDAVIGRCPEHGDATECRAFYEKLTRGVVNPTRFTDKAPLPAFEQTVVDQLAAALRGEPPAPIPSPSLPSLEDYITQDVGTAHAAAEAATTGELLRYLATLPCREAKANTMGRVADGLRARIPQAMDAVVSVLAARIDAGRGKETP